jgi:hypothetical protein
VRELDGKQSNLNHDVQVWLRAYPVLLYAYEGLRHLSSDLRKASNLTSGATVNEVVTRFLEKVAGTAA